MKKILLILFLFPTLIWSQKTSIVKGFIKDSDNNSIENVSVRYGETGTSTNSSGFYQIRIPVNIKITLKFSHVGYKTLTKEFFSKKRNIIRFSPVLISENEVLEEVVLKNETLSDIMLNYYGSSEFNNKILSLAIVHFNKKAFVRNNPNFLFSGKKLYLPSVNEIKNLIIKKDKNSENKDNNNSSITSQIYFFGG